MAWMMEIIILILSTIFSLVYIVKWYNGILSPWPQNRSVPSRVALALVPFLCAIAIMFTLRVFAAFDVVEDAFYIYFYVVLGFWWVHYCMKHIQKQLDLDWQYDGIQLNNMAAVLPVISAILAVTIIYCGANIGDGPGWWCVIYAGAFGLIAFFVLGNIFAKHTNASENVTVGRDYGCAIRYSAFLLSIGIILGRACGGDWSELIMYGFIQTAIDFVSAWPALVVFAIAMVVEKAMGGKTSRPAQDDFSGSGSARAAGGGNEAISLILGAGYIVLAIIAVITLPSIL